MFKGLFGFLGDVGRGIYTVTKEGLQFVVNLPSELRSWAMGIDDVVSDVRNEVGEVLTPNQPVIHVGGAAIPVSTMLIGAGLVLAVVLLARK